VIVPKSTLGNWMNEFRRFCPSIRTIKFHGNAEDRVRIEGGGGRGGGAGDSGGESGAIRAVRVTRFGLLAWSKAVTPGLMWHCPTLMCHAVPYVLC
jgi:hypothetical protein